MDTENKDTFETRQARVLGPPEYLLVWIPDSVRMGDAAWSIAEACKQNAANGHWSGWCMACVAKLRACDPTPTPPRLYDQCAVDELNRQIAELREQCAKIVESEIDSWCGTATEPSEQCQAFCEQYGCSTLRKIARRIREGK